MNTFLKRAWAEISIDNIKFNYNSIRSRVDDKVKIMSVVKADAYGHGVKYVAPVLDRLGTDWFAVSNIEEALQLRELNINKPILILGYTPPYMARLLSDNSISQTVFDSDYAKRLSDAAIKDGCVVKAHIKIDTGMGRLGFVHHDSSDTASLEQISGLAALGGLTLEGIFTHFASSDTDGDESGEFTLRQFTLFCDIIERLRERGISFALRHCCNSAATLNNPEMHLDMVRPGIILYGMEPSGYFRESLGLHTAMNLKSVISMVKTLHAGDCISYGRTYTANGDIRVATIPIGYADGYPRMLSNKGYVMINGHKAAIVGRICMDQMIVDVTGIDGVSEGQSVCLFGSDENGSITVEQFAELCGTVNYETVCIIGKRVTRVYFENGKQIGTLNYVYNLNENE